MRRGDSTLTLLLPPTFASSGARSPRQLATVSHTKLKKSIVNASSSDHSFHSLGNSCFTPRLATMVFYFTSNVVDPPAFVYVGKDKFESACDEFAAALSL